MNPGWSYILTTIGVFGLWLAGRKDWRGWLVGLSAQGVWLAYAVATQQWGFIVSAFAYGWVYALNIWRMRQAPKEPKLMTADTPRRARSLRKDGHVNRVGIVRQSVRDRIEGRAIVTGPPLRRMSKCLLCNLDSGPWLTTQAAEVSGLLHITGHHACMGDGSQVSKDASQ